MQKKSLIVALAGEPNVGKSTLLNALIGEKISIVTHKVQTTRHNVKGIVTIKDTQLVFIDTPGLFEPSKKLEKLIVSNALAGLHEADLVCFLFDSRKPFSKMLTRIKEVVLKCNKPCYAIINKMDLLPRNKLLPLINQLNEENLFKEIFAISAMRGEGVDHFKEFLASNAKEGMWFYEDDQITDQSIRSIAEEITREQIFFQLHEEIPYSIKVETENWAEDEEKIVIHQSIFVIKESQKTIILGTKGSKIKLIGTKARLNIQRLVNKRTNLHLFVKVREDWIDRLHA